MPNCRDAKLLQRPIRSSDSVPSAQTLGGRPCVRARISFLLIAGG